MGKYFNADVLQESGQKVLVLRENLTSYTEARFVKNEQKETLREASSETWRNFEKFGEASRMRFGLRFTLIPSCHDFNKMHVFID